MPESGAYGSVRGALSNERPYREPFMEPSESMGNHDSDIVDADGVG